MNVKKLIAVIAAFIIAVFPATLTPALATGEEVITKAEITGNVFKLSLKINKLGTSWEPNRIGWQIKKAGERDSAYKTYERTDKAEFAVGTEYDCNVELPPAVSGTTYNIRAYIGWNGTPRIVFGNTVTVPLTPTPTPTPSTTPTPTPSPTPTPNPTPSTSPTPTPTPTTTPTPTPTPTPSTTPAPPEPPDWATNEFFATATSLGLVTPALGADYTAETTRLDFCKGIVNMIRVYLENNPDEGLSKRFVATSTSLFSDVSDADILIAAHIGVAKGDGMGKFKPNDKIDRQQAAAFLDRARDFLKLAVVRDTNPWKDDGKVANWAVEHVKNMRGMGVFNGTEEGAYVFAPNRKITHIESIATLYRLYMVKKAQ